MLLRPEEDHVAPLFWTTRPDCFARQCKYLLIARPNAIPQLWLIGAEGREHPAVRYRYCLGLVVLTEKVTRRGTRDMRTSTTTTISQFIDWDSARSGQLQPRRPMRVCRPKEDGRSAGACTFTVRAKPRRSFTASIMTIGAWHSLVCRRPTAPQPPRVLSTSLCTVKIEDC